MPHTSGKRDTPFSFYLPHSQTFSNNSLHLSEEKRIFSGWRKYHSGCEKVTSLSSLVGIPCCRTTFCTLCYANKSSPVTCLVIFLAYILLYSPYGVMKVGMRVLLVLVTFLNMLRRCMRWASYALLISYSP